jgi:C-terminal processing protease CtpA/Prc
MIINAVPGGGAAESGLGTGDEILLIDGVSVKPMTLSDAISLLRGAEGTSVTLVVVKPGDTQVQTVSTSEPRPRGPSGPLFTGRSESRGFREGP